MSVAVVDQDFGSGLAVMFACGSMCMPAAVCDNASHRLEHLLGGMINFVEPLNMNDLSFELPSQVRALVSYLDFEPYPMIVLDLQYRILAANVAYQRQFGRADKPYVGHRCYQVSHQYTVPCDQAGEHCPMKKAFDTKGPDRVLHIHHTPRGPEHVDVELRPILDENREVVAYVERICTVKSASAQAISTEGLVGISAAFTKALAEVQRVAPSMLPVLLQGESGTGKELFARAVHESSQRAAEPFVVVDCSGLTETLFESELFGHEKGAFTGANARKMGLVETAEGGTLFLDEIGDVPMSMQVKLLRLIESGTYRRVGAVEMLRANFRLVAATHKPLLDMVAQGLFRQDLYYRIAAFPVHLPALRERSEDIPLLVSALLQRGGGQVRLSVTDEASALLRAYAWPGNIRELRNVLERAKLWADDGVLRPEHLPDFVRGQEVVSNASTSVMSDQELKALLSTHRGNRKSLAKRAGLSERTLYRRLKSLGLSEGK